MPLQPSDEQLYRAVLNLQADPNFKVIRSFIGRRHLEEMSKFHSLADEVKMRWAQGRDAEILDLYNKLDPNFAVIELERLMKKADEAKTGRKAAQG